MTRDQAKDTAKSRLLDYVNATLEPSPNGEKNKWCCPKCGSGHGEHRSGALSVKGEIWTCFRCNESGDIFDLYAIKENIDPKSKETFDGVYSWCGLTIDEPSQPDRFTLVPQPPEYAPEDYAPAPEGEYAPEDYAPAPDIPSYSKGEGVVYFITDDESFGDFMAACSAIGGAKALSEHDTKVAIETRNTADAFVFCVNNEKTAILENTLKDEGAIVTWFTADELPMDISVTNCVKAGIAKAKALRAERARLKAEERKEAAKKARSAIEFVKAEGIYKRAEESLFVVNDLLADKAKQMCEAGYPAITVSDFLTLAQGNDFLAGVIFACRSSQNKTIGDFTELDYLCIRAKKLNLPFCALTDFDPILQQWNDEDKSFETTIETAYSNLNDIKADCDKLNKSFDEIDQQILNYDTRHFYTATFGEASPFEKQNMTVIVARSGTGKTVALTSICVEALEAGKRVIFLTLEEPERQMMSHLVLRRYAGQALKDGTETLETLNPDPPKRRDGEVYITWQKAAKGEPLTEKEFALNKAKNFIAKKMRSGALHIGLHDSTAKMAQYLRYTAKDGDVVLIDYQQLIKPTDTELIHDKFAKVAQVSKELANLAKERGIILIVGAQMNREGAGKPDALGWSVDNLEQGTVKDSDEIFQDAGLVIAIGAEKSKSVQEQRRFFRQLKNRLAPEDSRLIEMEHALGYSYIRAMYDDEDGNYVVYKSHTQQAAEEKKQVAEESKRLSEMKLSDMKGMTAEQKARAFFG